MRVSMAAIVTGFRNAVTLACAMVAATAVQAQVILPVSALNYDAPTLPPMLWPTTDTVTRDLALLPGRTLIEKNADQQQPPYTVGVVGDYRKTAGNFGQINLGNSNINPIGFDGDVSALHVDLEMQRDDLLFGVQGVYEELDISGFAQRRQGLMPYGQWLMPINPQLSFNLLGTLYYFDNKVDSRLAPRTFSDYRTLGGSVSAALHFDTRYTYKAVTVAQNSPGWYSLMGSMAMTLQVQSDDAHRDVVDDQNVVEEVRDQRLLIFAGNAGVRLYERTALMLVGEYGQDLSRYGGALTSADSNFAKLALTLTRTLSPTWNVQAGLGRAFGHDVQETAFHLSTSKNL